MEVEYTLTYKNKEFDIIVTVSNPSIGYIVEDSFDPGTQYGHMDKIVGSSVTGFNIESVESHRPFLVEVEAIMIKILYEDEEFLDLVAEKYADQSECEQYSAIEVRAEQMLEDRKHGLY